LGKNLRLKSARAALDMSQKEVAEAVGVTRQTLNAIENGDYNPQGFGENIGSAILGG